MKNQFAFRMTVLILLFGLLGWIFVLSSCSSSSQGGGSAPNTPPALPTVDKEKDHVGEAAKTVGETSKSVSNHADKIDTHTTSIESKTPPEVKEAVKPEISGIREETKGLRQDSATLSAVEQKLKDTESKLAEQQVAINKYTEFAKSAETERAKLQNKIKDLESSQKKMLNTLLAWITVACVVGIGASVVIGFFFKTPAAFMIAAGCVATLGVSVAVSLYLTQIAWVALVLLGVGFIGAIAYVAWQIKNRDKAVGELVHTGEIAKTYLPLSAREKIFGNAVEPGVAHNVQSETTMKLVRNVRKLNKDKRGYGLAPELPKFWKPTVGDLVQPEVKVAFQDPYSVASVPAFTASTSKTILG